MSQLPVADPCQWSVVSGQLTREAFLSKLPVLRGTVGTGSSEHFAIQFWCKMFGITYDPL